MDNKFLIWGANGWIGSMLVELLNANGENVIKASSRLEDYPGICKELDSVKPDFVLNAAGIAGRPNIDWSESHQQETFQINIIGVANLAHACWQRNIHLTNYSTGCIYCYDDDHPIGYKFNESDKPNFRASVYSDGKVIAEEILSKYDNVLTLRIRLPITGDNHPKCLITKLSKYSKIINIPNSVSILPELLPISINLTKDKIKGLMNFTNPGAIKYNDLMALYKKYINPEAKWETFDVQEQDKILKAKRCNCELDCQKLLKNYYVQEVHESLENLLINSSKKYNL